MIKPEKVISKLTKELIKQVKIKLWHHNNTK
jgi:hypothetical protein